jgi:phosphoglycerate dehydrogenase-like enzyme
MWGMRVLISDPRPDPLAEYLRPRRPDLDIHTRKPSEVTAADLDWAETLVGFRRPPVPGWGNLRWIHSIGAGVDAFLFRTDLPDTILLTRSSEDFGPPIAEYCVARALAVTQHLARLAEEQRAGRWAPLAPEPLAGSRVVIAGTGMVGRGIAHRFAAMGCVVDGLSRSGAGREPFHAVRPMAEFDDAVAGARWLVLAMPLTEGTWHLLDRERLAACGGAYLINIGRGALLDEAALPEALDRGHLSGAALDVFETEPLPSSSPLWAHPKVTMSPHCSGVTTTPAAGDGFLECLAAVERGELPRWVVDRAVAY